MRQGRPGGFQIAFFVFALSIVCVPLSAQVLSVLGPGWEQQQIFRFVFFTISAMLILAFPDVRRAAAALLGTPIPARYRRQVALVAAANALMPLAIAGAWALWALWQTGPAGPERVISIQMPGTEQLGRTFSRSGAFVFVAGVFAAPVIEEVVFRGFLFKAWEQSFGWIWSAILSSATFAIYHPHFLASFTESLLYVALFRRTASLSAAIIVHSIHNLFLTYPLLGQFMFPAHAGAGFIETWWLQLTALAIALIAVPCYLWKAHRSPQS
jgi:CAAX amino terminal protease family.